MRSSSASLVWVIVLVACLVPAAGLLAACGSEDEPHLPNVTPSVTIGPGPGDATVGVQSSGSGLGVAGLVLTYPDGKANLVGTVTLEDGLGGSVGLSDLPKGTYTFTVYATPTDDPSDVGAFPAKAQVDENVIGSQEFVID